jgi:hypothetical protein
MGPHRLLGTPRRIAPGRKELRNEWCTTLPEPLSVRSNVRSRLAILTIVAAMLAVSCASGPSDATKEQGRVPVSTTTTEPPPEGIEVVTITNGSFRPSNLKLDLDEAWIVEWRDEDDPSREYVIQARNGEFESPVLHPGDTFQVDFSELEPGIYRYYSYLGNTRVPGSIDTRPTQ